jgi:hypothetical protein
MKGVRLQRKAARGGIFVQKAHLVPDCRRAGSSPSRESTPESVAFVDVHEPNESAIAYNAVAFSSALDDHSDVVSQLVSPQHSHLADASTSVAYISQNYARILPLSSVLKAIDNCK